MDAADGSVRWGQMENEPATPASTTKLLTTASALTGWGADDVRKTTVKSGATPNQLILVGGGDPLLKASGKSTGEVPVASLSSLAKRTARSLKASGVATNPVEVAFDDSLFSGATTSAGWEGTYVSQGLITPITALMANEGFVGGRPNADPSQTTAEAFVAALKVRGIKVTGTPQRIIAAPDSQEIASVSSAPMSLLVQHTLEHSDNTAAEVLGHLAGIKLGGSGSFEGGVNAVKAMLTELKIPTDQVTLFDGSGLSRGNKVAPVVFAQLLAATAKNANPNLWAVSYGNPIAGFTGTLRKRFDAPADKPGRGLVRAKTGSLTGISTLAGSVVDNSGNVLTFAFMASSTPDVNGSHGPLDKAASALATCGCQ